jgi:hypothetical protein
MGGVFYYCHLKNCESWDTELPLSWIKVSWGTLKRHFCCPDHVILFFSDPIKHDVDADVIEPLFDDEGNEVFS